MYNEQIKEILMKTYDVCAYTLDCGSSAARGKSYIIILWTRITKKKFFCLEMY